MKYGGNFTVSYVGSTFRVSYLIINEFFYLFFFFYVCIQENLFYLMFFKRLSGLF